MYVLGSEAWLVGCEERLYGKNYNVHQSHSQNDSGDLRGVEGIVS